LTWKFIADAVSVGKVQKMAPGLGSASIDRAEIELRSQGSYRSSIRKLEPRAIERLLQFGLLDLARRVDLE